MASPVIECLTVVCSVLLTKANLSTNFLESFRHLKAKWTAWFIEQLLLLIWRTTAFIGWRCIDCLCLVMLAGVFATVVRIPQLLKGFWQIGTSHCCEGNWFYSSSDCCFGGFSCLDKYRLLVVINFFAAVFVDLPTYAVLIVVHTSPLRWSPLWTEIKKENGDFHGNNQDGVYFEWEWRGVIWQQFYLWALDVLFLPFFSIVFFTGYRLKRMLRNMETADTEALKRWAAIKEFLHILVDLPCIAVGLAVCCTWRMPIIVWRFFQLAVSAPVRSQAGLRSLPWAEFATLFIDIPAIALSPFALATWRIYPTWLAAKQVYAFEKGTSRHDNKGWSQQRFRRAQEATLRSAIVANGLYFFVDIVTAVCFVLSLVTWRNYSMILQLRSLDAKAITGAISNGRHDNVLAWSNYVVKQKLVTVKIWQTAFNVLLDIPFLLMGLFVSGTLFRLPALTTKLRKIYNEVPSASTSTSSPAVDANDGCGPCPHGCKQDCGNDGSDCCASCCSGGDSSDFLSCNVCDECCCCCDDGDGDVSAMGGCDTHYLNAMWNHRSFEKDWRVRKACATQAGLVLLDLLVGVLAVVVVGTVWRAYPMYKAVAKKLKADGSEADSGSGGGSGGGRSHAKARKAVVKHFGMLVVDLVAMPCFFICLFSWRSFGMVGSLVASGDFFNFFAITTLTEFIRFLIDVPTIFTFSLMIFLRPMQSWTLLLEDNRHAKFRKVQDKLVKKHVLELLDAIRVCNNDTSDFVAALLKEGVQPVLGLGADNNNPRSPASNAWWGKGDISNAAINAVSNIETRCNMQMPISISKRVVFILDRIVAAQNDSLQLSPEYAHLLNGLFELEKQRPILLMRAYYAEYVYALRPDAAAYQENLRLVKGEEAELNRCSKALGKQLVEFAPPPPPLWTNTSGFWTRTRGANQDVVLSLITSGWFVTAMLLVPSVALFYRFPLVVHRLAVKGRGNGDFRNANKVLVDNLVEHFLDLAALLTCFLVCLNPNQMIPMLNDVRVDLRAKKSVTEARKTIFAYLGPFWEDIVWVASAPFQKVSYIFIVVSVVWGTVVPLDLFQSSSNMFFGGIFTAFFTAVPFVLAFYVGPEYHGRAGYWVYPVVPEGGEGEAEAEAMGESLGIFSFGNASNTNAASTAGDDTVLGSQLQDSNSFFNAVAAVYGFGSGDGDDGSSGSGSLGEGVWVPPIASREDEVAWVVPAFLGTVIVLAFLGAARRGYANDPSNDVEAVPVQLQQFKFATLNWTNIALAVGLLLDFLQLSALTLRLNLPVAGALEMQTFGDGMFLTTTAGFVPGFAIAVSAMLVWYFVASAPSVFHVLEDSGVDAKDIASNRSWRLAACIFGSLLATTIFEVFVSGLTCDEDGYLLADSEMECWTGNHKSIGAVCLYGSFWLVTTSSYYIVQHNLFGSEDLQVQLAWPHMLLCHAGKFAMVLVSKTYSSATGVMTAISLLLFIYAAGYRFFMPNCRVSNSPVFAVLKTAATGAVAAVSIAGLAATASVATGTALQEGNMTNDTTGAPVVANNGTVAAAPALDDTAAVVPVWIGFAGILLAFVCMVVLSVLRSKPSLTANARANFQTKVIQIADKLAGAHTKMRVAWSPSVLAGWKWRVRNVVHETRMGVGNPRNDNYLYLKALNGFGLNPTASTNALSSATDIIDLAERERQWRKGGRFGGLAPAPMLVAKPSVYRGFDDAQEGHAPEGGASEGDAPSSPPPVICFDNSTLVVPPPLRPRNLGGGRSAVKVGMRLEAKDRSNPGMICVASISAIDGDELTIHFDGWTGYDYTTQLGNEDLHYVGYCKDVGHILEKPGPGNNCVYAWSDWEGYLLALGVEAVPRKLFDSIPQAAQWTPHQGSPFVNPMSASARALGAKPSVYRAFEEAPAGALVAKPSVYLGFEEAPAGALVAKPSVYLGFEEAPDMKALEGHSESSATDGDGGDVDDDVDGNVGDSLSGATATLTLSLPPPSGAAPNVSAGEYMDVDDSSINAATRAEAEVGGLPPAPTAGATPNPTPAPTPPTPKQTIRSEAYPLGARTPLRRSPTPKHEPPQLPDHDTNPMQLQHDTNPMQLQHDTNPMQLQHDTNPMQLQHDTNPMQLQQEEGGGANDIDVIVEQPRVLRLDSIGSTSSEDSMLARRTPSYVDAVPVTRQSSVDSIVILLETGDIGGPRGGLHAAAESGLVAETLLVAVEETMFDGDTAGVTTATAPANTTAITAAAPAATTTSAASASASGVASRILLQATARDLEQTTSMSKVLRRHVHSLAARSGDPYDDVDTSFQWRHCNLLWSQYSRTAATNPGNKKTNKVLQDYTVPWWNAHHNREFHDAQHILLQLEDAIRWECMSIPFLAALSDWRSAVKHADWDQLHACAEVLEAACSEPYVPTANGFAAAADPDDSLLPYSVVGCAPFVAAEYAAAQAERSRTIKRNFLAGIASDELQALLEKVLPSSGYLSMVEESATDADRDQGITWYTLQLDDPLVGTITETGDDGYSAGMGAKLLLSQTVSISSVHRHAVLGGDSVKIKGVKGAKGISIGLTSVTLSSNSAKYIFNDNTSYKGAVQKVLSTIKTIDWMAV